MQLRHHRAAAPNARLAAGFRVLVLAAVAVLLMFATVGFAPTVMAVPYGAVSLASDQATEPPADKDAPPPDTGELDEAATEQPAAGEPSDAPTDGPASSTEPEPTQPAQTEIEPSPTETEPSRPRRPRPRRPSCRCRPA